MTSPLHCQSLPHQPSLFGVIQSLQPIKKLVLGDTHIRIGWGVEHMLLYVRIRVPIWNASVNGVLYLRAIL